MIAGTFRTLGIWRECANSAHSMANEEEQIGVIELVCTLHGYLAGLKDAVLWSRGHCYGSLIVQNEL